MQQICGNCKTETNFLMNGLCGPCMGFDNPEDGILDSGLTTPVPGPIEIYNAFRGISPETFPEINADGEQVGVFNSGLSAGQTRETASPIINKYWAIDYTRLAWFEAEVDRLVAMHKHELSELLALESAMIGTISYAMRDARLRYGMLVRQIERGDGRTELSI